MKKNFHFGNFFNCAECCRTSASVGFFDFEHLADATDVPNFQHAGLSRTVCARIWRHRRERGNSRTSCARIGSGSRWYAARSVSRTSRARMGGCGSLGTSRFPAGQNQGTTGHVLLPPRHRTIRLEPERVVESDQTPSLLRP